MYTCGLLSQWRYAERNKTIACFTEANSIVLYDFNLKIVEKDENASGNKLNIQTVKKSSLNLL
jgi:hypothetical protein